MKRLQWLISATICVAVLLVVLAGLSIARQTLPIEATTTLEKGIKGWNSIYGEKVRIERWNYAGNISNNQERESVLGRLLNPVRAHFPDLGIEQSKQVRVFRLIDAKSISKGNISAWQSEISDIVKVGQHVVNLKWIDGDRRFETLTITNNSTIVYDTMLSNVILEGTKKGSFITYLGWIWQYDQPAENFTRGRN